MTIKAWNMPLPPSGAYGQREPLPRKANTSVVSGHRSFPAENQGLLARMDSAKDNVSDSEYSSMLRSAQAHPAYGDGGADYAQDEFERRHDRRQGTVQTHTEDGKRIPSPVESMQQERGMDSLNFPSDKNW